LKQAPARVSSYAHSLDPGQIMLYVAPHGSFPFRRWWQFSLRKFFVFVTVFAVLAAPEEG